MGMTIAQKIIQSHLLSGDMTPGSEVGLKIDQTLTQDATGTMAYLEFEAMGIEPCPHGTLCGLYRSQYLTVWL